jgi:hypothetical protein
MANGKGKNGKVAEEAHGLFGGVGQRPGVIPENPDPNDVDGDGSGDAERKPPTLKEQQASNLANPHLKVPPGTFSFDFLVRFHLPVELRTFHSYDSDSA